MWRAEKFLARMDYRGAKQRFTPIHRPHVRKTTPSSISRIQRRSVGGASDDIEVLMNGHHANVQLLRELFLHKFVESNARRERSEVWRNANGTLVRPELNKNYSGGDNIVNLEVKFFPRATHILRERLVIVSSNYESSVSEHIRVAGEQGFNLVAVALVVIPREFTQYPERTEYVTYFQVQDGAVFDAPFPYDQPDAVFSIQIFPVSYKTVEEAEQRCRFFTQPRFLSTHLEVIDPLTRKRLTYRDEQLLFNEHLLKSGVEMQGIDARAHRTRYGDPIVLNWSATEEGDAFDETHPKANAPPRSFYTWLKAEKGMFKEMWDAFHQGREEEEEEVPEQESTVVLHTFKFSSVAALVTGYIEVLDPYYCNILSKLQTKFKKRSMRLVQDEADGQQKTARERLNEDMTGPSYAEDSLEDGTCRQLLYWNIHEDLHQDILDYVSAKLYGDGPINITRRYLTDGYRELEYKEVVDDEEDEDDEYQVAMMRFDTHDSRLEESILNNARPPNLRVSGQFFEYTPGPQSQWPDLVLPGVQKTVPELFRHIISRVRGQIIRQHTEQENSHIFENVTLASIVEFTTLIQTVRVQDGSYEYEYEIVRDDPDALDFRISLKRVE